MFSSEMTVWAVTAILSVAQACTKGEIRAVPGRCDIYQLCDGETWTNNSCGFGKRFDSVSLRCVQYAKATCVDLVCNDGEKVPSPVDCKHYNQCVDNAWVTKKCPWYYWFDSVKKDCYNYFRVTCAKLTESPRECADGQRKSVDCKHYAECEGGQWTRKTCWPGWEFDVDKLKCLSYFSAKCTNKKREACREEGATKGLDCKNYAQCTRGVWVSHRCPLLHDFDEVTKTCAILGVTCTKENCAEGLRIPSGDDCKKYMVCKGGKFVDEKCGFLHNYDYMQEKCRMATKHVCAPNNSLKNGIVLEAQGSTRSSSNVSPDATEPPAPATTQAPAAATTKTPDPATTKTPDPATTKTPVPTITKTPAPATTKTPDPATTKTPAPATTQAPAPATTKTPDPATTKTPAPATTQAPAPATTKTPDPATTKTPDPATTQAPAPATTKTPAPATTETPAPATTETPSCKPGDKTPINGSCKSYNVCKGDNIWVQDSCRWCQNFDPKAGKCVWAWKYRCSQ